jgi:hypothetical protein
MSPQTLAVPPVVGWNWTDEGRGKWGYVSVTKGETLRLKVRACRPGVCFECDV